MMERGRGEGGRGAAGLPPGLSLLTFQAVKEGCAGTPPLLLVVVTPDWARIMNARKSPLVSHRS